MGGLHIGEDRACIGEEEGTLSYICAILSPKAVLGIRGGWTLGDC